MKAGGQSLQGYRREHLHDAWVRYLPTLSPKGAEPVEPMEPVGAGVLEVPEVPAAIGSVRCRDCMFFDGEDGATTCLKFDLSVDPELERQCHGFGVPL